MTLLKYIFYWLIERFLRATSTILHGIKAALDSAYTTQLKFLYTHPALYTLELFRHFWKSCRNVLIIKILQCASFVNRFRDTSIIRNQERDITQEDDVLSQTLEPRYILAWFGVFLLHNFIFMYRILNKRIVQNIWVGFRDFFLYLIKGNSSIAISLTSLPDIFFQLITTIHKKILPQSSTFFIKVTFYPKQLLGYNRILTRGLLKTFIFLLFILFPLFLFISIDDFLWKFYWLGVVIYAELHIYSSYLRVDTNTWREYLPEVGDFIPNITPWKMGNATGWPSSSTLENYFLAPHLFNSHKKMVRFRDDIFLKDSKQVDYMQRHRTYSYDFREFRKFNLVEFTRMFAPSDFSSYERYCPQDLIEDVKQKEELYIYYMAILGKSLREEINNGFGVQEMTEEERLLYWLEFWEHPEKFYEIMYGREAHVFNKHTTMGGVLLGDLFPFYVDDIAFADRRSVYQWDIEDSSIHFNQPEGFEGTWTRFPPSQPTKLLIPEVYQMFFNSIQFDALLLSVFDACLDVISCLFIYLIIVFIIHSFFKFLNLLKSFMDQWTNLNIASKNITPTIRDDFTAIPFYNKYRLALDTVREFVTVVRAFEANIFRLFLFIRRNVMIKPLYDNYFKFLYFKVLKKELVTPGQSTALKKKKLKIFFRLQNMNLKYAFDMSKQLQKIIKDQVPVFKLKEITVVHLMKKNTINVKKISEVRWAAYNLNQRLRSRKWWKEFFEDFNLIKTIYNDLRRLRDHFNMLSPKPIKKGIEVQVYYDPTLPTLKLKKSLYKRIKTKLWLMEIELSYRLLVIIIVLNSYF